MINNLRLDKTYFYDEEHNIWKSQYFVKVQLKTTYGSLWRLDLKCNQANLLPYRPTHIVVF